MNRYKILFAVAIICGVLTTSCSQTAEKKPVKTTAAFSKVSKTKGAACCVSKVPSRFTIVKNTDSVSAKKMESHQ